MKPLHIYVSSKYRTSNPHLIFELKTDKTCSKSLLYSEKGIPYIETRRKKIVAVQELSINTHDL